MNVDGLQKDLLAIHDALREEKKKKTARLVLHRWLTAVDAALTTVLRNTGIWCTR